MRTYLNYAIFILLLFSEGCHNGNPCDGGGQLICVGIYYGSTELTDSSNFWIPSGLLQHITFSNGAGGGTFSYTYYSRNKSAFKDVLFSHTEQRTCGIVLCQDYCNSEHEIVQYNSTNGPFNIEIKREKDYYEYLANITTEKIEKSRDRLMVNLYSVTDTSKFCFKVLPAQKDSAPGFRFHDSLYLGNINHKNVYECYSERTNQNVYVKGIYYTTDNGLVGFYYNDNKVWYLQ